MPFLSTDPTSNKFQKGFLSNDKLAEDPTYMGWKILFDFTENSPLFYLGEDKPSAYQYLRNINMPVRAEMIKKFRNLLENLSKTADYYFQSISGLRDIWNVDINAGSKMRTFDKPIKIDLLEGLDMRITAMIDLYRKSCYD